MPLVQDALTRVAEAVGDDTFVVGCFDQSPFSLACALAGVDRVMMKLVDDPPFVEALVERCIEYAVSYGEALARAGADMLSTGDSPAVLSGPRFYQEFALPAERRVFAGLRSTGKTLSLHICGDTTRILADMATAGADVLEIDHAVDLEAACGIVPPDVAIWGNLDPVGLLARASPEDVAQQCARSLAVVRACGRERFVLSSGCTLAVETPRANLEALVEAPRTAAEGREV
jgi:MtaA/CmuA family methyltransferase